MREQQWSQPAGHRGYGRGRWPGMGPSPAEFLLGPLGRGERFGGPFGGPRHRHGPRVRRGDVRAAALSLLAEEPRNGYQIIQEIGARTDGVWRPSPGSVYPALQQLEDEGLIRPEVDDGGRKTFVLTTEGEGYVASHAEELRASWDAVTGSVDEAGMELRQLVRQVLVAVMQVGQAGSASQVERAGRVLTDTRRALYRVLAADEEETGAGGSDAGPAGAGAGDAAG